MKPLALLSDYILCVTFLFLAVSCNNTDSASKTPTIEHPDTSTINPNPTTIPGNLRVENLKELTVFKNADLQLKFANFILQKTYVHDRYSEEYHYNSAERGNIFITSSVSIFSKSKDPKLPVICAFILDGKTLKLRGTFNYNFSRWEDYGTFLGNNADFGNDFAHTEKIQFDIGLEVEKENIKGFPIYILAKNEPCVEREENRLKEPPVSYSDGNCITGGDISSNEELAAYTIIKIIKNK